MSYTRGLKSFLALSRSFLFLIVALSSSFAADELVIPHEIDLGFLSGLVSKVTVSIDIRNISKDYDYKITGIKGACTCFKSFTGNLVVSPGTSSKLDLLFDLAAFVKKGKWNSELAILGVIGTQETVTKVYLSARFDLDNAIEINLVPAKGKIINSQALRFSDSNKVSFGVFVSSDVAKAVNVEIGVIPGSCDLAIEVNKMLLGSFGRFQQVAQISLKLKKAKQPPGCRKLQVPVIISGGVCKVLMFECEVISLE